MLAVILLSLILIGCANAHGGVFNYTIDGVKYPGHYPWLPEEEQDTIQRRWWPDPIQDINHPYLACNRGNPLAKSFPKLHAPVKAGGTVQGIFDKVKCPANVTNPLDPSVPGDMTPPLQCDWNRDEWTHGQGPFMVYMADCGGPCDKYDGSGKKWFKILETHLEPGHDLSSARYGQWEATHPGMNITIPRNLRPGNYLIRHEIIMIELMPPQFYPYCAQLAVSGTGDKTPSEEFLVSFPGAYSYSDPGIAVSGEIYGQIGHSTFNYTVPGPKVWTGDE